MYLKIIRRSLYNLRDSYLIYVFSSSFAVAVLTLLMTLVQDPILQKVHYWNMTLQSILYAMMFVFAFFTFVYMAYVGGFFIKQQHQEFLTYRKLGMSKFVIAVIGFGKTFIIQIAAWIMGMIIAVILQKFVGMLLVYLMQVRINFKFYFTWEIVLLMLQIGIYSTIFLSLINGIRSFWMVRSKDKNRRMHFNWFMKSLLGILGVLMFLYGLGLTVSIFSSIADTRNIDTALLKGLVIVFLYFFGTYFIYLGFLPLVLDLIDKTKFFSYRGINLFSFKYLRSRLIKNTSIIWFVTELSAFAIGTLVFCYAGYQVVHQTYLGQYPFQVAATGKSVKPIQQEFKNKNTNVKMEYHSKIKRTVSYIYNYSDRQYVPKMISFMSYSDYAKMPHRITDRNPSVGADDFLELKYDYQSLTPGYRSIKFPVKVKNSANIKDRKVGSFFPYGTGMFSGLLMVVPDQYFNSVKSEITSTYYGWEIKHSDKLTQKFMDKVDKKNSAYTVNVHVGDNLNDSYLSKVKYKTLPNLKYNEYNQPSYIRQANTKSFVAQASGFVLFLISIFSIALLIALGSLLTLKVLLRDDYEWYQLKTLKKIGVTNAEIRQIVRRETTFLFTIPIVFALIQAVVVVGILNLSVNQPTFIPFLLIGISYIVLYGLVGFFTYILSWRGVLQKIQSSV